MKTNWFDSIEETLSNFDFEKVLKYMKDNDWKWVFSEGKRIPTIKDLKEECYYLLYECQSNYDGKEFQICTGGFRAIVNETGMFNLSFNEVTL